jgi:hypothetical protein
VLITATQRAGGPIGLTGARVGKLRVGPLTTMAGCCTAQEAQVAASHVQSYGAVPDDAVYNDMPAGHHHPGYARTGSSTTLSNRGSRDEVREPLPGAAIAVGDDGPRGHASTPIRDRSHVSVGPTRPRGR